MTGDAQFGMQSPMIDSVSLAQPSGFTMSATRAQSVVVAMILAGALIKGPIRAVGALFGMGGCCP